MIVSDMPLTTAAVSTVSSSVHSVIARRAWISHVTMNRREPTEQCHAQAVAERQAGPSARAWERSPTSTPGIGPNTRFEDARLNTGLQRQQRVPMVGYARNSANIG
ncbi:hypothetical protein ACU4HD_25340 [Cupriavidus basilensis]